MAFVVIVVVGLGITYPLYIRPGGRRSAPLERKQYLPMATAVLLAGAPPAEGCAERARSPRIMTSGWITVLPPSMMFWVPTRVALRATLLPVSCCFLRELVRGLNPWIVRRGNGLEEREGVRSQCSLLSLLCATWWASGGSCWRSIWAEAGMRIGESSRKVW